MENGIIERLVEPERVIHFRISWAGKAANAGCVATSGLEMSQNSLRYSWTKDEVLD